MHETTAGGRMPPAVQAGPGTGPLAAQAEGLQAGVTVYFPDGGRDLLYVEVAGRWVEYVKSAPPGRGIPSGQEIQPGPSTHAGPHTEADPVHWAGYTCHSPDEISRDRKRRVYYDPATRPDLLITGNGTAPALPLPVLELAGPLEDPEPWLDPDTGERFSSVQASTVMKLLRYAPQKPFTDPAVW
ncbi:hypothetical protein [Arthrobacter sp. NPDC057013]|uniref:hypothetical protein n=1 Tax=Arthrobacter sp. NPDC057013 TaxID=3345999 RepID=UPI00362500D4